MPHKKNLVNKLFFSILPIQILVVAIPSINAFIDSFIGSRYLGAEAMAAIGLFIPFSIIAGGVVSVFFSGAMILVTSLLGRAQKQDANKLFGFTVLLTAIVGVLATLLLVFVNEPIATVLNGGKSLPLLSSYMKGVGVCFTFMLISMAVTDFLQVAGKKNYAYAGTVAMIATNVVLDIVFVCVLNLGVFGIGLATGISYLAQCIVAGLGYFSKHSALRFDFRNLPLKSLPALLKNGSSSALGNVANTVKSLVMNYLLIFTGGTAAVAAMSIQNTFCCFLSAITVGIASTTTMMATLFVSEEDMTSLKETWNITMKTALISSCVAALLVMTFSSPLASLFFAEDPEALNFTKRALLIFPLYLPTNALAFILIRFYQAQQKVKEANVFSFMDNILTASAALILAYFFSTDGIWASLPVGCLALFVVMVVYAWIKRKKVSMKMENLILLPGNFSAPAEDKIEKTLYSADDISDMAQKIIAFCKDHGLDQRVTHHTWLSMEEMCALIFNFSSEGNERFHVDFRMFLKDGNLLLRLRNHGRSIFENDDFELNVKDDPTANIGIKMILKIADKVSYNTTFGFNVITIRLNNVMKIT